MLRGLEKKVEQRMGPLAEKMDEMIKILDKMNKTMSNIEKLLKKGD